MFHMVTICVSLASMLQQIKQYLRLEQRTQGANCVVRDLSNLVTWWSSLSFVDKLTRTSKNKAASQCEECVLNDIVAWTGQTQLNIGSQQQSGNSGEVAEHSESNVKGEQDKKDKKDKK